MLEAALAAGVAAAGGEVLLGGVLPTPAAPLLIGRYGLDLAAVLSASHNPYRDNGIKFFGADGYKLSDATELDIERRLERTDRPVPPVIGRIRALHGTQEDYLRALHERFAALDLRGLRVVLDCAHGATHRVAPEIFRRLGAEVTAIGDAPDGRNINEGCGSTHVDLLASRCATAATTSASPSTATATACSRSTAPARSSTATSSSPSRRCTCAAPAGSPATASR